MVGKEAFVPSVALLQPLLGSFSQPSVELDVNEELVSTHQEHASASKAFLDHSATIVGFPLHFLHFIAPSNLHTWLPRHMHDSKHM